MESTSLLRAEPETSPAPAVRSSRIAVVVILACSTLGVVAAVARPSLLMTTTASSPESELYSKKDLYGADYGTLLSDDKIQKGWPGLTCDRTDDDKWGFGDNAKMHPLDSGTNCIYDDTTYCNDIYSQDDEYGLMSEVSQLMWNHCNASCNATMDAIVMEKGADAKLRGISALAGCQFEGLVEMKEVCTRVPEKFSFESRRRYLAINEERRQRRLSLRNNPPSVPNRNVTHIWINQTDSQDPCNTHALCTMCVDDDGVLNEYCKAFLYYYGGHGQHSYYAQLFWLNVHFWCLTEVLDAIEDGTFISKVDSGEIPDYTEVQTAWTNGEAVTFWGTWKIPDDDFAY